MGGSVTPRQAREERAIRAARRSLKSFARLVWPILNPGVEMVWGRVHDAMVEHLEALAEGEIRRLLITLPPGHSKTTLVSICLPVWWWLRNPELRVIGASYDLKLATRININRRDVVRDVRYQLLRPGFALKVGQKGKTHFVNDRQGWMRAASTQTGITGEHADLAVVDDPIHPEQVYGPELEGHVRWFREVLPTRFRDQRDARWCTTMQRLHEADLAGVLKEQADVCHLNLPAEYDPAGGGTTRIGWRDWRRIPGEVLFPERFPREVLAAKRVELGPAAYETQYNQAPAGKKGNVFKAAWWNRYTVLPQEAGWWLGSVDANYRAGEDGSYFVLQVWAKFSSGAYLVDELRERLSFTQAVSAIEAWAQRYPQVGEWLIERKANGEAILDMLQDRIPGMTGVDPRGSKEARAASCAPMVEDGQVWVPAAHVAPWSDDWIAEHSAFPRGAHDDRVDASSQALRHLSAGGGLVVDVITPAQASQPVAPSWGRTAW